MPTAQPIASRAAGRTELLKLIAERIVAEALAELEAPGLEPGADVDHNAAEIAEEVE